MTDAVSSKLFTWDDFVALDDDDRRELIDGELVEVEVPNEIHERIVAALSYFLFAWARVGARGQVLGSGYKIRIDAHRGVMPDLQYFRAGNPAVGQHTGLAYGRPDLAVEIISPSSRRYDRVKKLAWYALIGVPEYWIVDSDARTIERLRLARARYVVDGSAEGDDVFMPKTFAGLTIPLAELWASPPRKRERTKQRRPRTTR